jgi:hypothetical protein
VKELQKQCMECDLEFEIICIDDCSTLHQQENQAISSIEKCRVLHEKILDVVKSEIF